MNNKVIIDAYRGGNDLGFTGNNITEKDFTLEISNYIGKRLNELGIENTLVRTKDETITDEERINRIKNIYGSGNNIIVISNRLNKGGTEGIEINYALRNNSTLAQKLESQFQNLGFLVKFPYQLRSEEDTSLDQDIIIRDTKNNQTIVIKYGNVDNLAESEQLKNNIEDYGEAVVRAIAQYLNIPYLPNNENSYIVQKGDSLYQIAIRFNTTVDKIKEVNNLTSNNLSIGQVLTIPKSDNNQNTNNITYTVQKGDTLYQIASKFNTTVDQIKKINNLTSNNLSIGQVLTIPKTNNNQTQNNITYTVQKGDSLYQIANKFNTTVEAIKKANNLATNTLQINQKLTIPVSKQPTTYIVQKGDSLYQIANKFNTTVDKIKKTNNLATNTLQIGQELIIN